MKKRLPDSIRKRGGTQRSGVTRHHSYSGRGEKGERVLLKLKRREKKGFSQVRGRLVRGKKKKAHDCESRAGRYV